MCSLTRTLGIITDSRGAHSLLPWPADPHGPRGPFDSRRSGRLGIALTVAQTGESWVSRQRPAVVGPDWAGWLDRPS